MMTLTLAQRLLFLAAIAAAPGLTAAPVRDGQVETELLSEVAAIQGGKPFTVALRMAMDEHWHTYWKNPGDSGLATSLTWTLPAGFSAGEIQWPVPMIVPTPPLISYGYEGEVFLLVAITPPTNLAAGTPVTLGAKAEWLMCREACIPGEAQLTLTLPVEPAARVDGANAAKFAAARARLPIEAGDAWSAAFATAGNTITLTVDLPQDAKLDAGSAYFYATTPDAVAAGAAQTATIADDRLVLTLTKSEYAEKPPTALAGVLSAKGATPTDRLQSGIALTATPAGTAAPADPTSLLGLLLPAFLGGLILNLMPCVFPVLGIKIMGFVNQAGADRRKVTLHGLVFTAGVLVSFWALAGALLALKAGGAELGWGFQLQEPVFVFALAVFLLAFGLNLSGVFEFGLAATSVGGSLQMKSGYVGSFFSGVLATIVSTPCAAPFLAPALGAAVTLPAAESFTLFTVIAVGLSGPYLFFSAFPRFVKLLPRPGAWMETFKQFMAFPLYATSAALVWVLAGQVESETVVLTVLLGCVLVALGMWTYGRMTQGGSKGTRRTVGFVLTAIFVTAGVAIGYPRNEADPWETWEPGRAEELRAEGKTVYVDFTARWCTTCQTNKLLVLNTDKIDEEFERRGIVRLKADWTKFDPEITRALSSFGRSAVPVNVIYAPGLEQPLLLPEILTAAAVLEAFDAAAAAPASARR